MSVSMSSPSSSLQGTRRHWNRLRLLVFDLDGTLVDSREDLVQGVNATLRHMGREPLPASRIATYVGDGATLLVRRALGLAPPSGTALAELPPLTAGQLEQLDAALTFFLDYYARHLLDATQLYPGIEEALERLAPDHILAVLTNKPLRMSARILEGLGVSSRFARIYGGDSFPNKKPDPAGLNTLLAEFSVAPSEAMMIGDSHVDMRTGHNAGVWTCGVTWGFAPHTLAAHAPHLVVENAGDLIGSIAPGR